MSGPPADDGIRGDDGSPDAAGWRRLEAAFDALVALDDDDRAASLADLERADPALAAAVADLLAADEAAPPDMDGPAPAGGRGDGGDGGDGGGVVDAGGAPVTGGAIDDRADDQRLAPGTRVGRFRVIRRVAAGGMGVVYEAEQDHPRRRIALKVVRPGRLVGSLRRRFELEGRILARLQHPGIAAVHDAGTAVIDGEPVPYLAMEFVDGTTIVRGADEAGLELRQRIELLARVADAVQHAHQRGVIHRDLKPGNILLAAAPGMRSVTGATEGGTGAAGGSSAPGSRPDSGRRRSGAVEGGTPASEGSSTGPGTANASSIASSPGSPAGSFTGSSPGSSPGSSRGGSGDDDIGQPKVLDFGVARLLHDEPGGVAGGTLDGQVLGTVPYMSPEQLEGDRDAVDTRTDVFALGVIGYELLTGQLPHDTRACAPAEAARRLAARPAPRPSSLDRAVRGDIEQVLLKAVAREPDRRYAAAGDLAADLRRVLRREPVVARPASAWYHLTTFARRHVAVVVTAAALVLVAAGAAASISVALVRERAARGELSAALDRERDALAAERDARTQLERDRATLERTVDFLADEVLAAAAPGGGGGPATPVGDVLARATDRVEQAWADDPILESEIRELLAGAWRSIGELDRAIEQAARSLELRTASRPPEDEWVIAAHHNLAGALIDAGRPEEAIPHVDAAIIGLQRRPDLQPRLVTVRSGHASMLIGLGRFDEAIAQAEAAVALAAEVLDADAYARLVAHQNLSVALRRAGRSEEALPHATLALDGYRRTFGPDEPATVMQADTVGGLLGELGRLEEAATMLEGALATKRRLLGDEHPQTVMSMVSLGRLEIRRDRYAAAESLLREAIETAGRVRGPDDEQRLTALNALGMVLRAREQWAEAEPLHEQLADAVRRTLGPRHPAFMIVRTSLAEVRLELDRPAEAATLLAAVLQDAEADLPPSHPEWVRVHRLLGRAHDALGESDAASAAWSNALAAAERVHGPEHEQTVAIRARLAMDDASD